VTSGLCTGAHNLKGQTHVDPWWAALAVWGVVSAVNVLQAAGFLSRGYPNRMAVNHSLDYVMIALAVPTTLALVAFLCSKAAWLQWIGSPMFLPYLALLFGAIVLSGLPFFPINRSLSLVTVATSVLLTGSMSFAMLNRVG